MINKYLMSCAEKAPTNFRAEYENGFLTGEKPAAGLNGRA